ncbi:HDA1 complex subunit 3 [Sphaceloma murrayae]|uniref:HDA1 complex subunit 3 n=1 Tax=Sphaceloma murrayae TaxID=2082308 RepID=A0A2K1QN40_9PEZI|nr:HDA1 complex subunit 3 [Sphaceloma murrayae]
MPAKRKRTYEASTSKKRRKQEDHIELGDPGVFEVDEILEERAGSYKISWAPNSVTGQPYSPTWEKKSNVNREAIEDWEEKKRQRPRQSVSLTPKQGKGRPPKRRSGVDSAKESSPATPIPRASRRIIQSSPSIGTQLSQAALGTLKSSVEETQTPSQRTQGSLPESFPTPQHQPFEITVTHLRQSQQDQYSFHDSSPTFPSSQVITGTAPQLEQGSSSQDHISQRFFDAAAAPDLTQKHSQFENADTTGSGNNTTTTANNTSSDIKPSTFEDDSIQPVTGYSQGQLASQSYVPPTQTDSKTSHSGTTQSNDNVVLPDQVEDISDWSASSPGRPPRSNRYQEVRSSVSQETESASSSVSANGDHIQSGAVQPDEPAQVSSKSSSNEESARSVPLGTHISETFEERDFASQPLSSALEPTASKVIALSLGSQSFDETDILQRPIGRQGISLQRTLPSSIDPAILPVTRSSDSVQLQDSTYQQDRPNQARISRERDPFSHTLQQAFSQRPSQRSRRSTPKAAQRASARLGSPFHDSRESAQNLRTFESIRNSRTSSDFRTQISAQPPRPQAVRHGEENYLDTLQRNIRSNGQHSVLLDISSGSLPQPPSQWPETFHSAPPRPTTPSDLPATPTRIMSSRSPRSAPSNPSVTIQDIKEAGGPITPAQRSIGMTTRSSANRAGSPALARDARSPSVVPPAEVVPMPTKEENSTSERYLTLVPEKPQDAKRKKKVLPSGIVDEPPADLHMPTAQLSNEHADVAMETSSNASISTEFAVPLFFLGHQRDNYKQTVVWHRGFLEEYLVRLHPETSSLHDKARELLAKLHQVTLHPDLLNEESFTQVQTRPEVKAQWDKDISAKFRFLNYLLTDLASQNVHIVIDVEQGRLLDILDNFLTGLNIDHVKAGQGRFEETSALRVTLLPKHIPAKSISKADLVIGFEGSKVLIEEGRKDLRMSESGNIAPLLYLVIPKSVEHVERYVQSEPYKSMSALRRLAILVENVGILRNEAGYRQIHDQDSQNCAASISKWLLDGHNGAEWPVDELPDVDIVDSTTESQATTASESTQPAPHSSGAKRSRDASPSPQAKKARIDPNPTEIPSTINPASLSLSAITDSADRNVVAASEYISELESLRQTHEVREAALESEVHALSKRLSEHITALEDLQYRHEDQRAQLIKIREERDEAHTSAAAAAARLAGRDEVINKLKGERDGYRAQLDEAKAALHSHVVPEIAEVEKLKSRVEELEREKGKMEARIENARKDAEYVRGLYQEASGKAAALAEEKSDLESSVEDLERRAGSAAAAARAASKDKAGQILRAEVKRLKLELGDREKVLNRKDEEIARLKEKERGRMGTRGGSVPRSPGRLGSPMRLEPPRSSGVGSRAQ